MAATADLTLTEISADILDAGVASYVSSMPSLPDGVSTSEFFAKVLQAAAIAQIKKNNANVTATPGERLNAYSLPTTGTVQTDITDNLQFFTSTYQLQIVSVVGLDTSSAAYA
ncbi:MAG: hypothetical protein KME52_31825 [Desmonostoc geniculatum HA4340-LM1]|jgi:hypothetical protein|nr:hypothetical protein [Desmonostoc geniculatum HA4340-LM1]